LEHYLEARAEHAVTDVGDRLGRAANRLAQPGSGGDLFSAVGRKLGEGASPGKMALRFGASRVKDATTKAVKSLGGKGGDDGGGGGNGKAAAPKVLTIIEDIDVGVPVREAYNQWTQFEEFGRFAKGVVSVEQQDDTATEWRVKVAKAQRSWRAKITEQVPDEKIAWTSEGDKGTTRGVVTFHELDENLTRVLLVIEYSPKGFIEKTGRLFRSQGRRIRLDLKRYRAFLMMRGEATGAWRGRIHEGRPTDEEDEQSGEQGDEETRYGDEEDEEEEPYDEEEEPYEDEEEDEEEDDRDRDAEDEEEDGYDDEYEEEDEEDEEEEPGQEERPRRRSTARR
jgi:uncharacterized membrane protein